MEFWCHRFIVAEESFFLKKNKRRKKNYGGCSLVLRKSLRVRLRMRKIWSFFVIVSEKRKEKLAYERRFNFLEREMRYPKRERDEVSYGLSFLERGC